MKLILSLVAGFVATYIALVLAVGNLDAVSSSACSADFTLPALACRFASLGITLVAVPFCGVAAAILTWIALRKTQRK